MNRMRSYIRILASLCLLGCAAPSFAQYAQSVTYVSPYPFQWYINAGGAIAQGDTSNDFDNGWSIGGGVNFRPDPTQPFFLRAEANYNRFSANSGFLDVNPYYPGVVEHGSMQTVTGFVDGVLEAPVSPWMKLYATGGVGIGWRRTDFFENTYCFVGCVGFPNNFGVSQDSTHFAWNAGGGANFPLPNGQSWFIEARYERIEAQAPTVYVPIRVGYRF